MTINYTYTEPSKSWCRRFHTWCVMANGLGNCSQTACSYGADIEFVTQTMNGQTVIDHDRDWIIGCIQHDGFIHTHRFDKANQIILDALSADTVSHEDTVTLNSPISIQAEMVAVVRCKDCKHWQEQEEGIVECSVCTRIHDMVFEMGADGFCSYGERKGGVSE